MDPISFVVLRSIERILAVFIGCFLIYLGYRLFLEIPAKEDSEGKFTLPGGTAIQLTRVGPGVFFSLFGTAIVIFSLVKTVDYKVDVKTDPAGKVEKSVSYLGAGTEGSPPADDGGLVMARSSLQMDFIVLNQLPEQLRADLTEEELFDIKQALPRIKMAAMQSVWDKNWGTYQDFRKWHERESDSRNPPEQFKEALNYFDRR